MDSIRKQARLARRRLTSERLLRILPWTMLIALSVAVIGLALPKVTFLPVEKFVWFVTWLATSAALGLLVGSVMTFLGRPTLADAAAEIDRRFGLRERLSSAIMLGPEDRETELGQALAADAQKKATQIDVRDKFKWGLNVRLWAPVIPALIAIALWYLPDRAAPSPIASNATPTVIQVTNSTKPLIEQIRKKREDAEKQGLQEAVDMFRKLEGELAKLEKNTKLDTKQTLAKLNDINEQLEKRKEELGSSESLKKNLKHLEKFEQGPADKFADALKQGDFDKAQNELEKLMEQMTKDGGLTQQDQEKLEKQIEQLEKALQEASQAHEQAKQALQEQMKQAEASGDTQKAAQLERKLAELQAMDAQIQQMEQLASSLAQAKDALQKGDVQTCKECMGKMASQLDKMSQQNSELQDLDQLMDSLSQSKSQMMCKECNGMGCSKCMGNMFSDKAGRGMGEGRGQGERPEEETDTDFFDSRIRDQMKQGETVYGGKVGGENRKGTSKADVQEAVLSSLSEEPEPLDDQPLPRNQREHTREYFNAIREGKAPSK